MSRAPVDRAPPVQKAVVIHPDARGSGRDPDVRLEEAVGLALALDLDVRAAEVARLRKTAPATLFGKGKVDEIMALKHAVEADVIVLVIAPVAESIRFTDCWRLFVAMTYVA